MSAADKIIADYREAYLRANGSPAPQVTYHRGWFNLGFTNVRATQVQEFTARLNLRAETAGKA